MKKIPTLFQRDPDNMARVLPEVHPDCRWVLNGEGWPTRKLDGMCCAIVDGIFVKRREVKKGKPAPEGFVLVETDEATGKSVGWVPVGDGPEDAYFREAFDNHFCKPGDGTYELIGPKSQGNVENFGGHAMVPHKGGMLKLLQDEVPRDFDSLRDWLEGKDIEGVVWHHPDGRMAKIKGRDFGHVRPKG